MSYALGLANYHFILFCADRRYRGQSGEIEEDFRKVFKLNNKIAIAITGNLEVIHKLFHPFLLISQRENNRFEVNPHYKAIDIDYISVFETIKGNYTNIVNESSFNDFICSLGGWDGQNIRMDAFFSSHEESGHPLHMTFIPESAANCKISSMGKSIHLKKFNELLNTNYLYDIPYYCKIFHETLLEGTAFDDTINTHYDRIFIKRSDFK